MLETPPQPLLPPQPRLTPWLASYNNLVCLLQTNPLPAEEEVPLSPGSPPPQPTQPHREDLDNGKGRELPEVMAFIDLTKEALEVSEDRAHPRPPWVLNGSERSFLEVQN